jgi:N-formylglutamate amidohydrolase
MESHKSMPEKYFADGEELFLGFCDLCDVTLVTVEGDVDRDITTCIFCRSRHAVNHARIGWEFRLYHNEADHADIQAVIAREIGLSFHPCYQLFADARMAAGETTNVAMRTAWLRRIFGPYDQTLASELREREIAAYAEFKR